MDHDELAGSLRSWRDRLDPADAGLPAGRRRRAPGLRRQELAQLAGLSVDYLARLEQGRAANPSPSVLAPLARALRLSDAERSHLYRAAGHTPPGDGVIDRHLSPGVQRILDRLADVPVLVVDPSWQIVAINPLAQALLGDTSERNQARELFSGGSSRLVRTEAEQAAVEAEVVSDLRAAIGRYDRDEGLRALVEELRASSARFAELWDQHAVALRESERKTIQHPEVGPITVDCDVLTVQGSDLRVVVFTAAPGSSDANALALLETIGLQAFA